MRQFFPTWEQVVKMSEILQNEDNAWSMSEFCHFCKGWHIIVREGYLGMDTRLDLRIDQYFPEPSLG